MTKLISIKGYIVNKNNKLFLKNSFTPKMSLFFFKKQIDRVKERTIEKDE